MIELVGAVVVIALLALILSAIAVKGIVRIVGFILLGMIAVTALGGTLTDDLGLDEPLPAIANFLDNLADELRTAAESDEAVPEDERAVQPEGGASGGAGGDRLVQPFTNSPTETPFTAQRDSSPETVESLPSAEQSDGSQSPEAFPRPRSDARPIDRDRPTRQRPVTALW